MLPSVDPNQWGLFCAADNHEAETLKGTITAYGFFLAQVPGACYARVNPTPLENPRLVAASEEALRLLDLSPDEVHLSGSFCLLLVGL